MRYIYTLGLISLFHIQSMNAQIQGYYSHKLDKNRSILLIVYPNNLYSLTWDYNGDSGGFSGDHIIGDISCGIWSMEQEKIILTDRYHNFQTICTHNHIANEQIEIIIENSFKWLTGLKITKFLRLENNAEPNLNNFPWAYKFNKSSAEKEREENYNEENPLPFDEYIMGRYHLWIYPNNTYMLGISINPIIYTDFSSSEGTWERKGNVLTLYDTSANCPFYLIITEKGLKPNQMMFSLHESPFIFKYKE